VLTKETAEFLRYAVGENSRVLSFRRIRRYTAIGDSFKPVFFGLCVYSGTPYTGQVLQPGQGTPHNLSPMLRLLLIFRLAKD